ncbi:hypothetical protein HMPREF3214_00552 [Alloscardovia omnicolens]|nr:hypothetical protein HMPREF3214_00552 [Alloscardovia omnicolens]
MQHTQPYMVLLLFKSAAWQHTAPSQATLNMSCLGAHEWG